MSKETETTLLIVGALAVVMVMVYLLTKPATAAASTNDLSWSQVGAVGAMIIELV